MAQELEILYDTGATVTAKVYGGDDAVLATVTLTETPAASGTYVGDFPAVVAGDYDVEFFDGDDVIGAELVHWAGNAEAENGAQAYLTVLAARSLLSSLPQTVEIAALAALTDPQLAACLLLATADIDAFGGGRYQGRKYDPNQELEFPRIDAPLTGPLSPPPPNPALAYPWQTSGNVTIWDWDSAANGGRGGAVVPAKVQLACLYQAAWQLDPSNAARLAAIRAGLKSQATASASETYLSPAELAAIGGLSGLCDRAQRLLQKYRLRSGGIL